MTAKYCYPHIDEIELPDEGLGFCWRGLMRDNEAARERLLAGLPPEPLSPIRPHTPAEGARSVELPSPSGILFALEEQLLALLPWALGFLTANVFAKLVIGRSIQVLARLMNP